MSEPPTTEERLEYLERQVAILECMVEVNRIVTSTPDLSQLLDTILQVAMQLSHTEAGSIMLLDEQSGELYFEAAAGPTRELVERFSVPRGQGISGWALMHDEPLIVNDVSSDGRHYSVVDASTGFTTRSMMAAPLRFHGQVIGVLALINRQDEGPFTEGDLRTMMALAAQVAIAIEHARLFSAQAQALADLERANRQLQEMDKLKSAFISVITHELRTPFANLSFSLELLERYGTECWLPEQREQMAQLKDGVESAQEMVDNLVDFATFLSKQGELRLEWVNIRNLVHRATLPLRQLATSKGIAFYVEEAEELPLVYADQERLSDAVYHLAQNACKFTPPGGSIWVRCRAEPDCLRLEVQDTGVGIPQDKLPGLWEGFAQMADPVRRGMEGLGLGLALVKHIATAHGGQVYAKSVEGVGSRFGLSLPVKTKADQPHPI
jgi:K+-sensing histidine kinase KdpD